MKAEDFINLVAEMRANQKFAHLYPWKYKNDAIESEHKVDDFLKRHIHAGEQLT